MLQLDDKQIKKFESDLKTFAAKAYPYATRTTVNQAAFDARKRGRQNLRNEMVLRNAWTLRSVQVETTRSLNVYDQAAVVGATVDYLNTQEFGGAVRGSGKHKPIATHYAAGEGDGSEPRMRLPRAANQIRAITLQRTSVRLGKMSKRDARRQMNAAAIREAIAHGDKFVYLVVGRRQGIFRIIGGKRKDAKVRMVWDMSRTVVHVKPRPWLLPAVRATQQQIPEFYSDALWYQCRQHKILGY